MLWMMNNKITKDDLTKITEALPECTINVRGTNPLAADWQKAPIYHEFEIAAGLALPDPTATPEPSASPEASATPDGSATPAVSATPTPATTVTPKK